MVSPAGMLQEPVSYGNGNNANEAIPTNTAGTGNAVCGVVVAMEGPIARETGRNRLTAGVVEPGRITGRKVVGAGMAGL